MKRIGLFVAAGLMAITLIVPRAFAAQGSADQQGSVTGSQSSQDNLGSSRSDMDRDQNQHLMLAARGSMGGNGGGMMRGGQGQMPPANRGNMGSGSQGRMGPGGSGGMMQDRQGPMMQNRQGPMMDNRQGPGGPSGTGSMMQNR